jgi:hypothetical protein
MVVVGPGEMTFVVAMNENGVPIEECEEVAISGEDGISISISITTEEESVS